jgi:arylsulfatase A-like enzyme
VRRLYAAEIRALDEQIGRLVSAVRRRFPDTIVVFAADHGESLGEHGFYYDHGDYVYNASSRVPLAFVPPPGHPLRASGRRSGWVSLVDVAPTVFELAQREVPAAMAARMEGRSLVPALRGEPLPPRPVFTESGTSFFPYWVKRRQRNDVAGRFRAVTLGRFKLIWTPFLPEEEAFELYDVEADPHETRNLYRPDHPRVPELRRQLDAWLARAPGAETPPTLPTPAVQKALRALGYTE